MGKQIKKVSTHTEKLLASFKYFMGACLSVLPFLTQFFSPYALKGPFPTFMQCGRLFLFRTSAFV